jgi:hypothetical protein
LRLSNKPARTNGNDNANNGKARLRAVPRTFLFVKNTPSLLAGLPGFWKVDQNEEKKRKHLFKVFDSTKMT